MKTSLMTISQFAKAGGVGIETIRYYHRQGLLPLPEERKASYRAYNDEQLQQLLFIRKAQRAGFTLKEIKQLLTFDSISDRTQIQNMTKKRLEKLNLQIKELQILSKALSTLLHHCEHTKPGAHCPILEAFIKE